MLTFKEATRMSIPCRHVTGALVLASLLLGAPVAAADAERVPADRLRLTVDVRDEPGGARPFASLLHWLQLRVGGLVAYRPGTKLRVTATAYSSTVSQTDLTPCVTAIGTRVRRGVVATNFLPIGTRLKISDETFVVEDRMNERYNGKFIIDIWHPTTKQAKEFGARILEVEIIETGKGRQPRLIPPTSAPTPVPPTPVAPSPPVPASPQPEPTPTPAGFFGRVRERTENVWRSLGGLLRVRLNIPQEEDCLLRE